MNDFESLEREILQINAIEAGDQSKLGWLRKKLDHDDPAIRAAAASVLAHRLDGPQLDEVWWNLLECEPDQDVIIPAISALARRYRNSSDIKLAKRITDALGKHGDLLEGTQEALDDGMIAIFTGAFGADLVRMPKGRREQELDRIRTLLCR
jgi:hypothetical protein